MELQAAGAEELLAESQASFNPSIMVQQLASAAAAATVHSTIGEQLAATEEEAAIQTIALHQATSVAARNAIQEGMTSLAIDRAMLMDLQNGMDLWFSLCSCVFIVLYCLSFDCVSRPWFISHFRFALGLPSYRRAWRCKHGVAHGQAVSDTAYSACGRGRW